MRLDKLFRVSTEVKLPGGSKVSVRVLSDPELRIREDSADRAARAVVMTFRDESSKEYQDNVAGLNEATDDALRSLLIAVRLAELNGEAVRSIRPNVIAMPDDVEKDEAAEVEQARDAEDNRVKEARREYITARLNTFRESISGLEREALMQRAAIAVSSPFAMDAYESEYVAWTIHMATDKKWTVDEVKQLHPKVRQVLMEAYAEVDSVDPFDFH